MRAANVFDASFEFDQHDPEGYRGGVDDVGKAAGGEALAVKLYELPCGQSLCPYHYEYQEEWLLVLDGNVLVRTPEGENELPPGTLVRFAPGPTGAHKVTNRAANPARVLMFSSASEPAVAVYPDSDKIGVWPGKTEDNVMLWREDGRVNYWEGER